MSAKTLMEPVKRFVNWCAVTHGHEMLEAAQGPYVLYSDYERLERELARLTSPEPPDSR